MKPRSEILINEPAHMRLEESVAKVCVLLEMLGDLQVWWHNENSEQKHRGLLTIGLGILVDDLKNRLLDDWEASHEEWRQLAQKQEKPNGGAR